MSGIEQFLMTVFLPILGVGGIGVTVIGAYANRKKTKAEATETITEGASNTIENSMKLESLAMERYEQTMDKLEQAEKLLSEVRAELLKEREYIEILQQTLRDNGIPVPPRPGFNEWGPLL